MLLSDCIALATEVDEWLDVWVGGEAREEVGVAVVAVPVAVQGGVVRQVVRIGLGLSLTLLATQVHLNTTSQEVA